MIALASAEPSEPPAPVNKTDLPATPLCIRPFPNKEGSTRNPILNGNEGLGAGPFFPDRRAWRFPAATTERSAQNCLISATIGTFVPIALGTFVH